jgi:hypothetical protein
MLQYTLTMTDHNDKVVLSLQYDYYAQVRETADLLRKGSTAERTLDINIIHNTSGKLVWSDTTREQ